MKKKGVYLDNFNGLISEENNFVYNGLQRVDIYHKYCVVMYIS